MQGSFFNTIKKPVIILVIAVILAVFLTRCFFQQITFLKFPNSTWVCEEYNCKIIVRHDGICRMYIGETEYYTGMRSGSNVFACWLPENDQDAFPDAYALRGELHYNLFKKTMTIRLDYYNNEYSKGINKIFDQNVKSLEFHKE